MKTTMVMLLALLMLMIGVLIAIGVLITHWLVPFLQEHLP